MMALPTVLRKNVNDLWALAADQLYDDDKCNINFSCLDKLNILADLHAETERSRRKSVESRWKYTRKSGETVIIRDIFKRIIWWIDIFKQVGDVVVQYNPMHAALPWAGIRFVLQIAVSDSNKLSAVVEGLVRIAECICRYAVIEGFYIQRTLKATRELERTLVKLYAAILICLSKAKHYLEQGMAKRILKSGVLAETQFDSCLNDIYVAENDVGRCMDLVDRYDKINNHAELKRLLACIDVPLRRMNDDLKNIHDDL